MRFRHDKFWRVGDVGFALFRGVVTLQDLFNTIFLTTYRYFCRFEIIISDKTFSVPLNIY